MLTGDGEVAMESELNVISAGTCLAVGTKGSRELDGTLDTPHFTETPPYFYPEIKVWK